MTALLQGEAKRNYQRDYMRRKRAGEPTAKPKPVWEPTQTQIDEVHWWFKLKLANRWRDIRGIGREVVADLNPNNEDGTANEASWNEAMRRYKALRDEQRANRKRKAAERDAPPPPECCSFCGKPKSAKRTLIGSGRHTLICARCNKRVAAMFLKEQRKAR